MPLMSSTLRKDLELTLGYGLLHRAGMDPIDARAPEHERRQAERFAELADQQQYRFLDLKETLVEWGFLAGYIARRGSDMVQDALRAAVTTGSLANIFTPSINAAVMASFGETPDTTLGWCSSREVPNFKDTEALRLGTADRLSRHKAGGEAEHSTISEVKEIYRIARYSKQVVFDDISIINDRLDLLLSWAQEMGNAAARVRPDLVYSILLANAALSDGVALFHATHGNLGSGPLAAATLEAAILAMGKQQENGVTLNIRPGFLIVPMDLNFTALALIKSAERIISANSGGTFNPLHNLGINPIGEDRIGVNGVTDPATGTVYTGTATNYFLACNPATGPTIEVGYLVGTNRRPTLRTWTLSEGQYGVGIDVKIDIGCKALDYRGLHKSTGA